MKDSKVSKLVAFFEDKTSQQAERQKQDSVVIQSPVEECPGAGDRCDYFTAVTWPPSLASGARNFVTMRRLAVQAFLNGACNIKTFICKFSPK